MTRMSKQAERRSVSPRRPKAPSPKTGPKKDELALGFKPLENSLVGTSFEGKAFIGKVK
jgi:hypothetical protein